MTLFTINDSHGRQKDKKTTKNIQNRILKGRNRSPKPLIFEITSLWIKQIVILELPYLHSLTSFWHWHRFWFDLVHLCMIMIHKREKQKLQLISAIKDHKIYTFIPHPLLKKSSENFHYRLFRCWSILINAEMLIMTKMKFKFVRFWVGCESPSPAQLPSQKCPAGFLEFNIFSKLSTEFRFC